MFMRNQENQLHNHNNNNNHFLNINPILKLLIIMKQ